MSKGKWIIFICQLRSHIQVTCFQQLVSFQISNQYYIYKYNTHYRDVPYVHGANILHINIV